MILESTESESNNTLMTQTHQNTISSPMKKTMSTQELAITITLWCLQSAFAFIFKLEKLMTSDIKLLTHSQMKDQFATQLSSSTCFFIDMALFQNVQRLN